MKRIIEQGMFVFIWVAIATISTVFAVLFIMGIKLLIISIKGLL